MNISLFRDPPVAPGITGFFGRDNELKNLYECITSSLPINCVVIGETYIGKTALLCQLAEGKAAPPEMQDRIIVYFDAMPRPIEHRNERASLHFWQGLYQAAHKKIADSKQKTPPFREA